MPKSLKIISIILLVGLIASLSFAQEDDFDLIVKIVKSGNAKELVKKFTSSVELNINGEEATYSKSQAEAVLKDFFDKNPPSLFELSHRGESKGGLPYAIGELKSQSATFRVWIRLDKISDKFLVSEMSFIEE
jgi:hypothetical protein